MAGKGLSATGLTGKVLSATNLAGKSLSLTGKSLGLAGKGLGAIGLIGKSLGLAGKGLSLIGKGLSLTGKGLIAAGLTGKGLSLTGKGLSLTGKGLSSTGLAGKGAGLAGEGTCLVGEGTCLVGYHVAFPTDGLYKVLTFNRIGKTGEVALQCGLKVDTLGIVEVGAISFVHSLSNIAQCSENVGDNLTGNSFDKGIVHIHRVGDAGALQDGKLMGKVEGTKGGHTLLGRQEVTLLFKFLGALFITFEGSGHKLIVNPLVTDKQETVTGLITLDILIGNLDELIGQLVLLLQSGVGQGGVDGILGQIRTLLTIKGGADVFTGTDQGRAYIINGNVYFVHLVNHIGILGNVAGHLVGHVHQGAELLRACLHNHIGGHDTVLVVRIAHNEFFHIGSALTGGLAGETGRLADVTAGTVLVNGPVHQGRNNQSHCANGNHRTQNDKTFFVFHDNYDLKLFLLQASGTKVAGNKKILVKPQQNLVKNCQKQAPTCKTLSIFCKNPAKTSEKSRIIVTTSPCPLLFLPY